MTADELRISDGSSYVCSSELEQVVRLAAEGVDIVADPARQFEADRGREIALRLLRLGIGGVDVGLRLQHFRVPRAGEADGFAEAAGQFFGHRRRHLHLVDLEPARSEEHTSELPSLMRISYAVFCLKKKNN